MPCSSYPPWHHYSNYVWRGVQLMKLPIMQFSPISRHFISLPVYVTEFKVVLFHAFLNQNYVFYLYRFRKWVTSPTHPILFDSTILTISAAEYKLQSYWVIFSIRLYFQIRYVQIFFTILNVLQMQYRCHLVLLFCQSKARVSHPYTILE
jgi:hypothetical protein